MNLGVFFWGRGSPLFLSFFCWGGDFLLVGDGKQIPTSLGPPSLKIHILLEKLGPIAEALFQTSQKPWLFLKVLKI